MATDSFVQVPTDGTGKRVDAAEYTISAQTVQRQRIEVGTNPTFYAVFDRIAPAQNKYMATLFNTSATQKVVITHIWRFNWQVATATGALLEQYLARITARTAGTGVTIRTDDTADTLSAGITADTNSTAVTENHIIMRLFATGEEAALTSSALVGLLMASEDAMSIYQRREGQRGLTLRQNEGISIRNVTNNAAGTVSYIFEFFDLPV